MTEDTRQQLLELKRLSKCHDLESQIDLAQSSVGPIEVADFPAVRELMGENFEILQAGGAWVVEISRREGINLALLVASLIHGPCRR